MKIVLAPFDLNDPIDPDWTIQPQKFSESFARKADKSIFSPIKYELRISNHGLGADWPTVTIVISSVAGLLLFAIPEAHKRVRESLEEWKHIKKTVEALIDWISPRKEIIQYPVELLYLDALTYVLEKSEKENSVFFLNHNQLPVAAELARSTNNLEHHLFAFMVGGHYVQIAIDSNRELLWSTKSENLISLSS